MSTVEIHHPGVANSILVPAHRVERYEARGWVEGPVPDDDASALKGRELDETLKSAGLPTTGTADEKRARLAAHQAGGDSDEGDTTVGED